jgi:type III pantothenate kinase
MNTSICIDWGNTLVKTAIFTNGHLVETNMHPVSTSQKVEAMRAIASIIEKHKPEAGIFCSVADYPDQLVPSLTQTLSKFIKLDSNTRLPIMNAYQSPETLGADRLAMAVAAQAQFPDKNVLAISAGTCITYNFVQKNKTFRGGAISPGLKMRLKAMAHFTDMLPEVGLDGETLLMGYDTPTCMRSGAVYGMAAEIDGIIAAYSAQYPDFNAILTGGDGSFFAGKLKSKIFADPDLLLKGLNLILKFNVPQLR